jgi:DNA-binding NarL/FixJ family response regulator
MKIAILGAGIMGTLAYLFQLNLCVNKTLYFCVYSLSKGITCAQKLKEQMPDCEIKIYTKEKSPNTTSDVSAGYWEPYCLSNDSDEERTKIL